MSPDEFKKIQSDQDWTNQTTANLLGVSLSTVEKWRSGAREIPAPVAKLIAMLAKRWTDKGVRE